MNLPHLCSPAYVLAVRDLDSATDYFVNALGFQREWSDAGNWQGIVRGEIRLRLGHCPDSTPAENLGDHSYFGYIQTDDVDALYDEFLKSGAIIRSAPDSKPWGWREMAVGTPEGHRMMFAQPV